PDGNELMYHSFRDKDIIAFFSIENRIEMTFTPYGEDLEESIISSPALSADGQKIAFSGVADRDQDGTFVYEGIQMDLETRQAEKITSFREHVASLSYYNDENQLIVTVDKNFAAGY